MSKALTTLTSCAPVSPHRSPRPTALRLMMGIRF
jgi:hypothetical protein